MPLRFRLAVARAGCALLLALAASAFPALAQSGRVRGTVADEHGRPIRGATVVARNPDATPSAYETTTDDRGRFTIIGLESGRWSFTVSAPGYRPSTGDGRIGTVGANPHFDFRLERGGQPASAPAPAPAATGGIAAADRLLADGHLEEAIAAYEGLRARAPASAAIALRLGQAHRYRRDFDRALTVLRAIPAADPLAGAAAREIGITLFEQGALAEADEALTRAATAPGAGRDEFYVLGEVKLARGRTGDAVGWFDRAAAADPAWPRPLLKLGLVAANAGQRETAANYLRQVVRLAPDSIEARQARTILEQLR